MAGYPFAGYPVVRLVVIWYIKNYRNIGVRDSYAYILEWRIVCGLQIIGKTTKL